MTNPTVTGEVHVIGPTKEYGNNHFCKRMVVLKNEKAQFTEYIPVDFIREDCESVNGMNVGDEVEIEYKLTGRRWQRDEQSEVRYFPSVEAISWRNIRAEHDTPPAEDEEMPF